MIGHYIPFDFGPWHDPEEPFVCPKHGRQDGGLSLLVKPRRDAPAIRRDYCGICVLEALDGVAIQRK